MLIKVRTEWIHLSDPKMNCFIYLIQTLPLTLGSFLCLLVSYEDEYLCVCYSIFFLNVYISVKVIFARHAPRENMVRDPY